MVGRRPHLQQKDKREIRHVQPKYTAPFLLRFTLTLAVRARSFSSYLKPLGSHG